MMLQDLCSNAQMTYNWKNSKPIAGKKNLMQAKNIGTKGKPLWSVWLG